MDNNMTALLEADEKGRERIITETNKNLFVEASAGSGKTTKLVERMISMVENGTDIKKICAITFTKNAANEFYRRFREEISNRIGKEKDEAKKKLFEKAFADIDLCFMGTIDAFCQMIVSEHPLDAEIPSDAVISTSEEMEALYRLELTKVSRGEYGDELKESYRLLRIALSKTDERIIKQMGNFMDTRNTRFIYEKPEKTDFDKVYAEEIKELREIISILCIHPEYLGKVKDKNTGKYIPVDVATLRDIKWTLSKNWTKNLSSVIYALKAIDEFKIEVDPEKIGLSANGSISKESKSSCYSVLATSKGHVGNAIKEYTYSLFVDFMVRFSNVVSESIKSSGRMSFFDYQMCLKKMLEEDAKNNIGLIKHIYDRHSYFLIDEFQDTNPMQIEIFFYITAEQPKANWMECRPRPGSLFIVGDPKQSIYRFRYADVGSYNNVKSLFTGDLGDVVYLYRNFRSTKTMRENFNAMFNKILPTKADEEQDAEQSLFDDIPGEKDQADDSPDTLTGVFKYETSSDFSKDADNLVSLVSAIVDNENVKIKTKDEVRKVKLSDIMVITPDKKGLRNYLDAFLISGIPVYVEGSTVFSQCAAALAVSAIMSAISHPYDAMKAYAAFKCPVFDVTDLELSRYCNSGGDLYLKGTECESTGKIDDIKNILAPLVKLAERASPSVVYDTIIDTLPVFEKCGTEYLEYVYYGSELIKDGEISGELSNAADGADYIENLITDTKSLERSLTLSREENSVHFANLHKVKGLEAPVVILAPGRSKYNKPLSIHTEAAEDGRVSYAFYFKDENYKQFLSTEMYTDKKDRDKKCDEYEKQRLLYVAATRAGNILIISDAKFDRAKNYWDKLLPFAAGGIYDIPGIEAKPIGKKKWFDAASAIEEGRKKNILTDETPKDKTYSIVRPSFIRAETKTGEENSISDHRGKPSPRGELSSVFGTMVHRLLEKMVISKGKLEPKDLTDDIYKSYNLDEGHYEIVSALTAVAEKMLSGGYEQENGSESDLLGILNGADEVYCELPFCHDRGNAIVNGVMDLVYRKGDKWHIVDYKTNYDAENLDKKYASQLEAYTGAFKAITGFEAESRIYHVNYLV